MHDTTQPNLDELITLKEAANRSGLSYSHVRYLARNGEIWAHKLGHSWVTTSTAVDDYLARGQKPGPKPRREFVLHSTAPQ